ncbi:hypothetical protein N7507_005018, partial [Penicillium longicatenatum]
RIDIRPTAGDSGYKANIRYNLPEPAENIRDHNIIIIYLLGGLLSSFYSIRFGLIVGISGGVLSSDIDIRLGDIMESVTRRSILADRDIKPPPKEDSRVIEFISNIYIKTL